MNSEESMRIQTCRIDRSMTCKSHVPCRKRAYRWMASVCLVVSCGYGGVANASIATFDALSEGALDISFSTGGAQQRKGILHPHSARHLSHSMFSLSGQIKLFRGLMILSPVL